MRALTQPYVGPLIAAGGAASGAIFGSVVDTFGATLPFALGAGAVAGVGGAITENAINGRGTSTSEVVVAATVGAAGAGIGAGVGKALSSTVASSFFAGTSYTPKVIKQMAQGDLHAFPESVKGFESVGRTFWKEGKDGISRQWLEIPGSYRGQDGVFQFIKESNGEINHRLFVPYR